MDTTGFFDYPTEPSASTEHGLPGFLAGRGEDDWTILLDHSETRLFRPGELVLTQGEDDRALYLLIDGWVQRAERRRAPDHDARRGRVPRRPPAPVGSRR